MNLLLLNSLLLCSVGAISPQGVINDFRSTGATSGWTAISPQETSIVSRTDSAGNGPDTFMEYRCNLDEVFGVWNTDAEWQGDWLESEIKLFRFFFDAGMTSAWTRAHLMLKGADGAYVISEQNANIRWTQQSGGMWGEISIKNRDDWVGLGVEAVLRDVREVGIVIAGETCSPMAIPMWFGEISALP